MGLLFRWSSRLGVTIIWLFALSIPSAIHLGILVVIRSQVLQRHVGIQITFIGFENLQGVQPKAIGFDLLVRETHRLIAHHIFVVQIVILLNKPVHQLRRSIIRYSNSVSHLLEPFALFGFGKKSRILLVIVPIHIHILVLVFVRRHLVLLIIEGGLDRFAIRSNIVIIIIVFREQIAHLLLVLLRIIVALNELLQCLLMERNFAILCDFLNFFNFFLDFILLEIFQSL